VEDQSGAGKDLKEKMTALGLRFVGLPLFRPVHRLAAELIIVLCHRASQAALTEHQQLAAYQHYRSSRAKKLSHGGITAVK
jgi:hypothetical protein